MVATPARGTEGMYLQHRFGSSRLVRLLQDWAQVDGESPRQDVAERLSHWLSAADAVQLDGSLHAIESYPAQTKLSGQAVDTREVGDLIRLDTRHLFDANTVWLGLKRGQLQRNYVWRFIELCNAGLSVDEIKRQVMEPEEVAIDYQI